MRKANMKEKFILVAAALIFAASVFADVPPPAGKTYVTEGLRITAEVNTEPYRFFLVSPINAKEVELKQSKPFEISGTDRGGAAKFAKFVAVPKTSLKEFEGKSQSEIEKALHNNIVPGAVELFSHSFQKEAPFYDEGKKYTAVYIIEQMRSGELTATRDLEAEPKSVSFGLSDIIWAYPVVTFVLIAAGILAAVIFVALIFYFVRSRKSAS